MDEGQNLNNGGSGLGAAGGFDAFQNNNTFQDVSAGMGGGDIAGGMMGSDVSGMGSGMEVPGPIVSSGDDIVLGSGDDGGRKSRRRLLLGVVAVVVVFALVAVGVFAMWKGGVFGGKGTNENDKTAIGGTMTNKNSIEKSFNNYINYVYTGDESNSNWENVSELNFVLQDDDIDLSEKLQFFAKATQLNDTFVREVNSNANDEKLKSLANKISEKFKLINTISDIEILPYERYLELVEENGLERATEVATQPYMKVLDMVDDNEEAKQYYSYIQNYYTMDSKLDDISALNGELVSSFLSRLNQFGDELEEYV